MMRSTRRPGERRTLRPMAATVAFAAVALLLAAVAPAAFEYTSQSRSVSAQTHGPGGEPYQALVAPNFDEFDQTAIVVDPVIGGFAQQRQRSRLLSDRIEVLGSFAGQPPAYAGTGWAKGSSAFEISFTVDQPTPVALSASASVMDGAMPVGSRYIGLLGPGMNVGWSVGSGFMPPSQVGVLTPGSYSMRVNLDSFHGYGSSVSEVSNFTVTLAVIPEPAAPAAMMLLLVAASRRVRWT